MKRILTDRIALAFAGVGIVLLAVAIRFNVNPVDCGAVRGGLQHHPWLFLPLAVATIPAMFMGLIVLGIFSGSADHPEVYYAASFVSQLLLYFMVGLAVAGIAGLNKRTSKRILNQASHATSEPASGAVSSAHQR